MYYLYCLSLTQINWYIYLLVPKKKILSLKNRGVSHPHGHYPACWRLVSLPAIRWVKAHQFTSRSAEAITNNRADILAKKATWSRCRRMETSHPPPPDRITRIPHPVLIITRRLPKIYPRSDDQSLLPWPRFQDSGSSQPPAPFELNEGSHHTPNQEREVLCQPHLTPWHEEGPGKQVNSNMEAGEDAPLDPQWLLTHQTLVAAIHPDTISSHCPLCPAPSPPHQESLRHLLSVCQHPTMISLRREIGPTIKNMVLGVLLFPSPETKKRAISAYSDTCWPFSPTTTRPSSRNKALLFSPTGGWLQEYALASMRTWDPSSTPRHWLSCQMPFLTTRSGSGKPTVTFMRRGLARPIDQLWSLKARPSPWIPSSPSSLSPHLHRPDHHHTLPILGTFVFQPHP